MNWIGFVRYFGENGWPSSKLFETPPSSDSDKEKLVDIIQVYLFISLAPCLIQDCLEYVCSPVPTSHLFKVNKTSVCSVIFPLLTEALVLQDWKTERYKEIIKSGTVEPRPGVLRLMDEVKGAGIKLAVCSAATKSSVVLCLENLIGLERFNGLDCFLAGDDVKLKKPDPSIYITAAKKLGVESKNCLVVEDSVIGLQAAKGAGMSCIITYTPSTANQDFKDAIATYPDLSNVRFEDLRLLLQEAVVTG